MKHTVWLWFLPWLLFGAMVDSDMDGVVDENDLCPNTPFDQLVDPNGCGYERLIPGSFTLYGGVSLSDAGSVERGADMRLGYRYRRWEFSISSFSSLFVGSEGADQKSLFVSGGYRFDIDAKGGVLFFGGVTQQDQKSGVALAGFEFDYPLREDLWVLGYVSHTFEADAIDTYSVSLQTLLKDRLYAQAGIVRTVVRTPQTRFLDTAHVRVVVGVSERSDFIMGYGYGLSKEAYAHTLSLGVGVRF